MVITLVLCLFQLVGACAMLVDHTRVVPHPPLRGRCIGVGAGAMHDHAVSLPPGLVHLDRHHRQPGGSPRRR
eukprot:29270-Pyramimonas_sp.AAC.1